MAHDSYSALSDPTRRQLLHALRHGPRPVGDLVAELEVSQPTVSKHLKVLRDARLVTTRAQGQKRFYSLHPEPLADVAAWLDELMAAGAPASPADDVAAPAPAPADDAVLPAPADETPELIDAEPIDAEPVAKSTREYIPWFVPREDLEPSADGEPAASSTAVEEPGEEEPAAEELAEIDQPEPAESTEPAEAAEQPAEIDRPEPAESTEPAETVADVVAKSVSEDTGISVGDDTEVTSAEPRVDSHEPYRVEAGSLDPEIPAARTAAAHRRQGGLLSTLTGFRRRGRGSRH